MQPKRVDCSVTLQSKLVDRSVFPGWSDRPVRSARDLNRRYNTADGRELARIE